MIFVVPFEKAIDKSKLVRKEVEVHRGGKTFKQMRYVKPDEVEETKQKKAEDPEDVRGSKHGYGMHNIEVGDDIGFRIKGKVVHAKIVDTRDDGVVVPHEGRKYLVKWKDIADYKGGGEEKMPEHPEGKKSDFVDPKSFNADQWRGDNDDPDVTVEKVIDLVEKETPGVKKAIETTEKRLKKLEQTIGSFRVSGEAAEAVYKPGRQKLHDEIVNKILSDDAINNAKPEPGGSPSFIMLGGRGGSGKSWFRDKVYDSSKCIVLDADEIKGMLPEYEGFNAFQVHEESSDILETILTRARNMGLNVVLDATMKTTKTAVAKVQSFKDVGYSFEAHYMHLPRQDAAVRAAKRFMGKTKRYVPVGVVLSNVSNEQTFEAVRGMADAWSFRDSQGFPPSLVSEDGKGKFSNLIKSLVYRLVIPGVQLSRRTGRLKKSKGEEKQEYGKEWDYYDCGPEVPEEDYAPHLKEAIAKDKERLARIMKERESKKG